MSAVFPSPAQPCYFSTERWVKISQMIAIKALGHQIEVGGFPSFNLCCHGESW